MFGKWKNISLALITCLFEYETVTLHDHTQFKHLSAHILKIIGVGADFSKRTDSCLVN